MVTKAVSDWFGKGGIADQAIRFNGFPFLDKEDHQFNEPVSHVMKRNILAIPATGLTLTDLERQFLKSPYRGFPVVQSSSDHTLLGYITRVDLRWAVDKAKRSASGVPKDAKCIFYKAHLGEPAAYSDRQHLHYDGEDVIDLSPWVSEVRRDSQRNRSSTNSGRT